MSKKQDKFFVGINFRKNSLAEKDSPITAEVHVPGESTKMYTNIHYPNALAKKIFRESPHVTHIVFKDSSGGNNFTIVNPNNRPINSAIDPGSDIL